jgi:hypothetical protein
MICAAAPEEIEENRRKVIARWRIGHRAITASLAEAGDRLSAFPGLPRGQCKGARTTKAIDRPHAAFPRRIETQTVLPCADTAAMLFRALMASGLITMRKVDGRETLSRPLDPMLLDRAARQREPSHARTTTPGSFRSFPDTTSSRSRERSPRPSPRDHPARHPSTG